MPILIGMSFSSVRFNGSACHVGSLPKSKKDLASQALIQKYWISSVPSRFCFGSIVSSTVTNTDAVCSSVNPTDEYDGNKVSKISTWAAV